MTDIEKVKGEIKVLEAKLALLEEIEKHKSPVEEAYKEWMGEYPPTDESVDNTDDIRWRAFQIGWMKAQNNSEDISRVLIEGDDAYIMGVKYQRVEEPSKPMNEVMDRLENKYKDAEENAASYITDEVVDRMLKKWETDPPSFLRFQLGKTLEALITRWWDDVYDGIHQDWDREVAIDDLIDQIQLWLPREGSSEGSQDHYAIVATDAENALLQKIKSKLRNKKSNK
jgi:hypothetical protein